jgi:dihydropteroate synthase
MQGEPQTMQNRPVYINAVEQVRDFLHERLRVLKAAGLKPERICVDPGFGFGKTREHNYTLLQHLADLAPTNIPLLVGLSRKSMLDVINASPDERLAASVAAAICAVERGARIIRVHDVGATVKALKVWNAIRMAHHEDQEKKK